MSEYTPTTEEVRENYARSLLWPAQSDPARAAFFDRWLAAHDAEVRQEQADHDAARVNDLDTRLATAERELGEAQKTITGHGGWDEWIAEHIRVEADHDRLAEAVQAAYNALHMETRSRAVEILHDALSGVVAEEPDWEYGVRLHPDIEYKRNENQAAYTPPTTSHPSLQRAQEMANLNPRYRPTYHRRRKAGPWVLVEN